MDGRLSGSRRGKHLSTGAADGLFVDDLFSQSLVRFLDWTCRLEMARFFKRQLGCVFNCRVWTQKRKK
jgi:hypothetical protein